VTIKEHARAFAEAARLPGVDLEALFDRALREELKFVAALLSMSADAKVKMYQELGLNGEDQARPYRDIADSILRRSEL